MSVFVVFLQILGLVLAILMVLAFATRKSLRDRSERRAEKPARIGVDAPAEDVDTGSGR